MQRLLLSALLIVVAIGVYGQKPYWIDNPPTPNDDSYYYEIGVGFGNTIEDAQCQALAQIMQSISCKIEQTIDVVGINCIAQKDSCLYAYSKALGVPIMWACDWLENSKLNDTIKAYVLCQVGNKGYEVMYYDSRICSGENEQPQSVEYDREKFDEAYKKYFNDN